MEHFLERIALLRHWFINPNEKSNKYKSSLLSQLTKSLTEHFLQGNNPLRHLLNEKLLIMSWRGSAFNEVNDWSLSSLKTTSKELKNIKYVIIQKLYQILGCFVDWKDWQGRYINFQTMNNIFFQCSLFSSILLCSQKFYYISDFQKQICI